MIDKWIIVGAAHFGVTAVVLKLLGLILPCCLTGYYWSVANFILYLCVARFTFEITKRWYLDERLQPENRAVFITGCDSGFGHNVAKLLDCNGYHVFAGCLFPNGSGAKDLKGSCSKRLQILEIDVTKDASVNSAADFVKENLGTSELWAIVNNAGILKGFEVELTDVDDFKDTMEVNAFGPVRVTKAFLPLLRQCRGRVINVASLAGRIPLPFCTPYTMSKYAAVAFSECLRLEMDVWGIRVISIEPEFFSTGLTNAESLKKQMEASLSNGDPDVKDDYGDKYIKNFKLYSDFIANISSKNIDPVLDAIDEAVSLRYPNSVYKPCRNIFIRMFYFLAENVPQTVYHFSCKIILSIVGFPKPQQAEDYL